nr:EOG090X0324 [Eulimnadia texana]
MTTFVFSKARKDLLDSLTGCIRDGKIDSFVEKTRSSLKCSDADKKLVCDQVFRDEMVRLLKESDMAKLEVLVQFSIDEAKEEICSATLPVILLTDAFDSLTLDTCEKLFSLVESKVSVWKQDIFFNSCKNNLLRMCNDLLRRLSRSQNTIFCGRILLFLAKFFPFSERSGLNVISEFNLDNVTSFGSEEEDLDVSMDEKESSAENSQRVDYSLYKKFWELQDFFRNPNQCYTKIPWKKFCTFTNDVLSAFASIKLDYRRRDPTESSKVEDAEKMEIAGSRIHSREHFFAKYLTNQKLLELQLGDSNFRRYILLQFLIMFQYLEATVKFKQVAETGRGSGSVVGEATNRIYRLLEDTPPDGADFVKAVQHILKREEFWNTWKNEGCPEFRPPAAAETTSGDSAAAPAPAALPPAGQTAAKTATKGRRLKRSLGDQVRDMAKKRKILIGNGELTRLWNLHPDNLGACRSKERDFLPSLETYFEEAIEQLDPASQIESTYKRVNDPNFGWRALRLLARRSPHFFTPANTSITRLPDYLENLVKKVAKDMPSSSHVTPAKSTDLADEPEEQVEQEAESELPVPASENNNEDQELRNEDAEMEDGEVGKDKKPVTCTLEQLGSLAANLGNNWKTLGTKLGFQSDEIEYFESENASVENQAKAMLQIWLENEGPDATPENLLYVLEGLGLSQAARHLDDLSVNPPFACVALIQRLFPPPPSTSTTNMIPNNVVSFVKKMRSNGAVS